MLSSMADISLSLGADVAADEIVALFQGRERWGRREGMHGVVR
jgi:hypothetical protein